MKLTRNIRIIKDIRDGADVWTKTVAGKGPAAYRGSFFASEAARLRAVARRGVPVPEVIELTDERLVLSDLGPTLEAVIRTGQADAGPLIARATETLRALHRAGGWHGNAALRNLTLTPDGQVGVIDFDSGVTKLLPLRLRQAYDLWQLVQSSVRFAPRGRLCRIVMRCYGRSAQRRWLLALAVAMSPLAWLLQPLAGMIGHDAWKSVHAIHAIRRTITTARGRSSLSGRVTQSLTAGE